MNWISVKDRLPEGSEHFLTYSPDLEQYKFRILPLHNGKFFDDVTHWARLFSPEDELKMKKDDLIRNQDWDHTFSNRFDD